MGNTNAKGRFSARRAAAFLGVLGALVMSTGVALMVAATPANAASDDHKVTFCHSTGSDSNPWIELTTDVHAFYHGHVLAQHTSDIYPAVSFMSGQKLINVPAQGNQSILANGCSVPEEQGPTPVAPGVNFTNPTCTTAGSWAGVNTQGVSYALTSGTVAPGQSVVVTASAKPNFTLTGGQTEFPWTFTTPTACPTSQVSTPTTTSVSPPKAHVKAKTKTHAQAAAVTPTVVHAGLTSVSAQDMRGEQGLALMVAGMVMLMAAGGLGLRVRGAASRI